MCDACDKAVMRDDVLMRDDAQENKAEGYHIFGVSI